MNLTDLFPDADYQFSFRFERAPAGQFFRPTAAHDGLVAERRRWLERDPGRYAGLLPEGVPLLEETIAFARIEGTLRSDDLAQAPGQTWERCLELGRTWEPDFVLLTVAPDTTVRLVGGCVCFPSSWSLEEKLGQPIEAIHGIVPGLNAALGSRIHGFLAKLRPGIGWLRSNWGLSRGAELNQHPVRGLPRLDAAVRLEEVWLRIEHQALVALPETKGILFGIRLALLPFREIRRDEILASRVARALATMPEEVARYKGLTGARERLLEFLWPVK